MTRSPVIARLREAAPVWLTAAESDAELRSFAQLASIDFAIRADADSIAIHVDAGGAELSGRPAFTLVAPEHAWTEHFEKHPAPTYHHFLAMRMRIEGTEVTGNERAFAQHLPIVRRVLELMRESLAGTVERMPSVPLDLRGISGQFVRVELRGNDTDLHVHSTGSGPPLLVLHTAGSDCSQAHPLMCDPQITSRYQVLAFDLPGHGASPALPETLGSWSLDGELYGDAIEGVIRALGLQRPVLTGASMAGEACLLMAHRSPDLLGGVIACEAADYVPGRTTPWPGNLTVNEATFAPEWVYGLIGPRAPLDRRDAIWRSYSKGGHRTFAGDIDFYSGGWDGRELLADIDTERCPVVMMTGEYDYSCTPAMSAATAERIPGAAFWTMPELGHFPICENPELFRPHLLRALSLIEAHRS